MYGLLVGLVMLVAAPRSALFFIAAVQASTHIHDAAALRVMRAPLAYFHTNPVGRMLNRQDEQAASMHCPLTQTIRMNHVDMTGALSFNLALPPPF